MCPSDCMSCSGDGSDVLSALTFKCSVFLDLPPTKKSRCKSPMIEGEYQTEDIMSRVQNGPRPPLCSHMITFTFSRHIC